MLILLAILIFIYNFMAVFYFLCRIEPLPTVEFLYVATFPCGVVWWLRAEQRKTPVKDLYCEGLLANYGWPIIIPYQLLKTRGVKGLLPIVALLASYFGSMVLAAVFYFLFVADFNAY